MPAPGPPAAVPVQPAAAIFPSQPHAGTVDGLQPYAGQRKPPRASAATLATTDQPGGATPARGPRPSPARGARLRERGADGPYDPEPVARPYGVTSTGGTFQMSVAYSRMVRSELNLPVLAMLKMALRVQASGSL